MKNSYTNYSIIMHLYFCWRHFQQQKKVQIAQILWWLRIKRRNLDNFGYYFIFLIICYPYLLLEAFSKGWFQRNKKMYQLTIPLTTYLELHLLLYNLVQHSNKHINKVIEVISINQRFRAASAHGFCGLQKILIKEE